MHNYIKYLVLLLTFCSSFAAIAAEIPEVLQPWKEWVLHNEEQKFCPVAHNNELVKDCVWYSNLNLDLTTKGGKFKQQLVVYAPSWVIVAGDEESWPKQVTVNGEDKAVVAVNNKPMLRLDAGNYNIEGAFSWQQLPNSIYIPAEQGLVNYTVDSNNIRNFIRDADGRLWLQNKMQIEDTTLSNTLQVKIFRLLDDNVPFLMNTFIRLDVGGEEREITVPQALLPDFIPTNIVSRNLPAYLKANGDLVVVAAKGSWWLEIKSRHMDQLNEISLPKIDNPMVTEEIWAVKQNQENRLSKISGVSAIDPKAAEVPSNLYDFANYLVPQGATLKFNVLQRGISTTKPDLSLSREAWLSSDGKKLIFNDVIMGNIGDNWRLTMQQPLMLGQISVDSDGQVITKLEQENGRGFEIRNANLNVRAVSTADYNSALPLGWQQNFSSMNTTLWLPPGWRLLHASGVDSDSSSWVNTWSFLDAFLVLLIAVACSRMFGAKFGALALVTLVLIYHEPDAPRLVWLNLLAAMALVSVASGRIKKLLAAYSYVSLVLLIVIATPFVGKQLLTAFYPQLEHKHIIAEQPLIRPAVVERVPPAKFEALVQSARGAKTAIQESADAVAGSVSAPLVKSYDANAIIPTGPGVPDLKWNGVQLITKGPVVEGQVMKLKLLSPLMTTIIKILGIALTILLIIKLALRFKKFSSSSGFNPAAAIKTVAMVPLVAAMLTAAPEVKAEMPTPEILNQFKERLLEPPACLPSCAAINYLNIGVANNNLMLELEVAAIEEVAVPLPVLVESWMPQQVTLNGQKATALKTDAKGSLWLYVNAGINKVAVSGDLQSKEKLQLPLELKPKAVNVVAEGWQVTGVNDGKAIANNLFLTLSPTAKNKQHTTIEIIQKNNIPGFAIVKRQLILGVDLNVTTEILRQAPLGQAVSFEVPLIPGEQITTKGVEVENNKALVSFDARQVRKVWQSKLDLTSNLKLTATTSDNLSEVWQLAASPLWHVTATGIPLAQNKNWMQIFELKWLPWANESVELSLLKPDPIALQTFTIDSSTLTVTPGKNASEYSLSLAARSSKAGQHTITIPVGAKITEVSNNRQPLAFTHENGKVTFPLTTGPQLLDIKWQQSQGINWLQKNASIDLGINSVNSNLITKLPLQRWVLLATGPSMGPAILLWGILLLAIIFAVLLGKIKFVPIKTWEWVLLILGISFWQPFLILIVVAWLLVLGKRQQIEIGTRKVSFNLLQIAIVLLTLIAMLALVATIVGSLIGQPQTFVIGNGSGISGEFLQLRWYQDLVSDKLPVTKVISLPMWTFKVLMLMWALWLAQRVIKWLRWGYISFTTNGVWR